MASVTVLVEDAQVRATLGRLADLLGNQQDVMDEMGGRLVNLARTGFTQQRTPDGTPWKGLAASTILSRKKSGHWPGPILRVSGNLMGSLNWKATPTSVEIGAGWGASAAYAAIHQFGGRVLRPLRRGVLRFKIGKDGTSRFAKKSKANFERDATFGGKPVVIPARPYLPTSGTLPDAYLESCLNVIATRLMGAANG